MNEIPAPVITLIWVVAAVITLVGVTARITRRRIARRLSRHGDFYGATLVDPHTDPYDPYQEWNDR